MANFSQHVLQTRHKKLNSESLLRDMYMHKRRRIHALFLSKERHHCLLPGFAVTWFSSRRDQFRPLPRQRFGFRDRRVTVLVNLINL